MIYFVQPVDGGPIKIGYSNNPESRIRGLENYYGVTLATLKITRGERDRENELHRKFADLRFRGTEQFRPERKLLKYIGVDCPKDYACPPGLQPLRPVRGYRPPSHFNPEEQGYNLTGKVNIDAEILRKIKVIISLNEPRFFAGEYVSFLLQPLVESAYEQVILDVTNRNLAES